MKNKIVFTQDLPRENEWITSCFPGSTNLETIHSGKWDSVYPIDSDEGKLYQIPYSDNFDCDKLDQNIETYKSVYSITDDVVAIDRNWCFADSLLLQHHMFGSYQHLNNTHYQAFTFGRCGTIFIEQILQRSYTKLSDHIVVGKDGDIIRSINNTKDVTIALTYRSDWWAWLSSTCIASVYGFHHHSSKIDWDNLKPITISIDDFIRLDSQIKSTWDYWCNLRCRLPNFNFYLLRFEDVLASYANTSLHQQISYDKKSLISNYDEAKNIFEEKFSSRWKLFESRCVQHLLDMGCETKF